MIKRLRLFLTLSALGAALVSGTTGCTSVNVSHEGGRTLVDIANSSWLLLNFIPLASGCPEHPLAHHCKLFQNSVTLENNMKLLDYAVRREGAVDFGEIVSYTNDESVFFILLKHHVCHTSAELLFDLESVGQQRDEATIK